MFASALETQFARDVRAGLTQLEQKTLPCRYLYDNIGSALFEAITFLPEYGLTRADARVIEAHAEDLLDILGSDLLIAELGSGSGAKTRSILERVRMRQDAVYYPIDVSGNALAKCAQDLQSLCSVRPLEMSYLDGLRDVASRRAPGQRTARGLRGTITQAADDGRERRHRADRDPEKEHCSCRPRDIKVKGRSLRSVGGPLGLA